MQRETKIVVTPISKQKVELHTFITGRDRRAIQSAYFGGSMKFDTASQKVEGFDPTTLSKAQDVAWKTIVVSIDGHKDGEKIEDKEFSIVDTILDMSITDHDFVVSAVNEINGDTAFEQKKTN